MNFVYWDLTSELLITRISHYLILSSCSFKHLPYAADWEIYTSSPALLDTDLCAIVHFTSPPWHILDITNLLWLKQMAEFHHPALPHVFSISILPESLPQINGFIFESSLSFTSHIQTRSKFYSFYLQNSSRVWELVTTYTVAKLMQASIISAWIIGIASRMGLFFNPYVS